MKAKIADRLDIYENHILSQLCHKKIIILAVDCYISATVFHNSGRSATISQEAQLPQRDRATRYRGPISKFVLCFTSMGARNVPNNESNLQGHLRALTMALFDRPHKILISVLLQLCCTVSEILSLISQNLKRSRDSEHIGFRGNIIIHPPVVLSINQHTIFEVPSFINSKDKIGAKF